MTNSALFFLCVAAFIPLMAKNSCINNIHSLAQQTWKPATISVWTLSLFEILTWPDTKLLFKFLSASTFPLISWGKGHRHINTVSTSSLIWGHITKTQKTKQKKHTKELEASQICFKGQWLIYETDLLFCLGPITSDLIFINIIMYNVFKSMKTVIICD